MATIRKHRGKWQAIVRRKGQGSASKTFHIRRDAERWAREQELKLDNGTFGKLLPQEVTLAELLIRYRDTITVTKKEHRKRHGESRDFSRTPSPF